MNNMFCIHFGFLLAFHLPKSSLKLNSVGFAVRSVGSVLFLFLFGFLLFRFTTITLNKIELLTITRRVSFVFVVVVVVVVVLVGCLLLHVNLVTSKKFNYDFYVV